MDIEPREATAKPVESLPPSLGRYRVVETIGRGGMAHVSLGYFEGPGGFCKRVALKVIHPELLAEPGAIEMFLDEARTAARIDHPCVTQVFDLGEQDGRYWLAMEYLHGESVRCVLEETIKQGQTPVGALLAAHLIAEAAEGLHAAHELRDDNGEPLGLVHRDVSPHNLFVTYEGVVKVMDFGVAKVADRSIATRTGVLKGKIAYMSPEQALGRPLDRRTDVFALGIVLWELLTCRRLFRGASDHETLDRLLQGPIVPPSSLVPDVPPSLDQVVLRALASEPAARFATARELALALYQVRLEQGAPHGPTALRALVRSLFAVRINHRQRQLRAQPDRTTPAVLARPRDEESTASLPASRPPPAEVTVALGPGLPSPTPEPTPPVSTPRAEETDPSVNPRSGPPAPVDGPDRRLSLTTLNSERPLPAPVAGTTARPWLQAALVGLGLLGGLGLSSVLPHTGTSGQTSAPLPGAPPSASLVSPPPVVASGADREGPAEKTRAASGFLTVDCTPSCRQVMINGVAVGGSPITRLAVAAGSHEVQGEGEQGQRRGFTVKVLEGRTASVRLVVE